MCPWVTLAMCESCGKPMNKSPFDFYECSNFDCEAYGQAVSESELDEEEDEY